MCGIAGYLGSRQLPESNLSNCLARMQRRGPDTQAVYQHHFSENHHCYLLHSRLSIIDLDERANQPWQMQNTVLSYNGELYNYLELREQLAQRTTFTTSSDTEVLLQGLLQQGPDFLNQCEGMWAFAWYQEQTGTLYLSRDRFGEKPLYLYQDHTGLYFASEVKMIQALLGDRLKLNTDHLYRFLVNGYKAIYKGRDSFFKGLEELSAATVLCFDPEQQQQRWRYWLPKYNNPQEMSYAEAVAGTRERLIQSMKLRLRADVPVAFCMSGGIDSNSLISIAAQELGYDVHGFTIVNTDSRYEEQDMVSHMVQRLGLKHTEIAVETTRFLPQLRELVAYHDAPVYTITYYAHWLLQAAISQAGYRISVSGSAADELFSGYFDHHLAYLYALQADPAAYQQAEQAWRTHILPVVRNPYLQNPRLFIEQPLERDHIFLNAEGFAQFLRYPWSEPFEERFYHPELLRNRMLNELFHEATPVILHEDDLNAMYYSVENRSPFLDSKLFEWCQQIPTAYLIQEARTKSVLRDAMRGIVPDKILDNRRKVGFNAPLFDFLDVKDPEVKQELLADSPIYEHVHRKRIQTMLEREQLLNSESKFMFYFLSAKLFLETQAV